MRWKSIVSISAPYFLPSSSDFFWMSSLDFLLSVGMFVCQLRVETICMMKTGRSFLPVSLEPGSLPPSWPVTCWSPTSCWSTCSLLCSSQCYSTSQLRLSRVRSNLRTDDQNHRMKILLFFSTATRSLRWSPSPTRCGSSNVISSSWPSTTVLSCPPPLSSSPTSTLSSKGCAAAADGGQKEIKTTARDDSVRSSSAQTTFR